MTRCDALGLVLCSVRLAKPLQARSVISPVDAWVTMPVCAPGVVPPMVMWAG